MATLPRIECRITFLPASEGGRSSPPRLLSGDRYRPHLVIGEPRQRKAIVVGGRVTEEYIGVAFSEGPENVVPGTEVTALLTLMYYPHPMYEQLRSGTTFTIREGAQVVGYGTVQRRLEQAAFAEG